MEKCDLGWYSKCLKRHFDSTARLIFAALVTFSGDGRSRVNDDEYLELIQLRRSISENSNRLIKKLDDLDKEKKSVVQTSPAGRPRLELLTLAPRQDVLPRVDAHSPRSDLIMPSELRDTFHELPVTSYIVSHAPLGPTPRHPSSLRGSCDPSPSPFTASHFAPSGSASPGPSALSSLSEYKARAMARARAREGAAESNLKNIFCLKLSALRTQRLAFGQRTSRPANSHEDHDGQEKEGPSSPSKDSKRVPRPGQPPEYYPAPESGGQTHAAIGGASASEAGSRARAGSLKDCDSTELLKAGKSKTGRNGIHGAAPLRRYLERNSVVGVAVPTKHSLLRVPALITETRFSQSTQTTPSLYQQWPAMPASEPGILITLHIHSSDLDSALHPSEIAERKVRAAVRSSFEDKGIRTLEAAASLEPVQVLAARNHGFLYDMETLGRVETIVTAIDDIARQLVTSYQELPSDAQKRKPSTYLTELMESVLPMAANLNVDWMPFENWVDFVHDKEQRTGMTERENRTGQ
ncbi:hypothetical protein ACRALDRAFT_213684 [Sodiomyces alcalophilus JCM 7366]|uniref:uncharacterized protein n=1 Tax=Sodiomyces alcalophilus JCM 7366 TaxID=591952 RepID=UPI0039B60F18